MNRSSGKPYRLFEGTVLEAVLTNRLTGSFAGPVNCMLTEDVYSHNRQQAARSQKEAGSWARSDRSSNSARNDWPSSFTASSCPTASRSIWTSFKGLNQIGETGLKDQGQSPLPETLRRVARRRCDRRSGPGRDALRQRLFLGRRLPARRLEKRLRVVDADPRSIPERAADVHGPRRTPNQDPPGGGSPGSCLRGSPEPDDL